MQAELNSTLDELQSVRAELLEIKRRFGLDKQEALPMDRKEERCLSKVRYESKEDALRSYKAENMQKNVYI